MSSLFFTFKGYDSTRQKINENITNQNYLGGERHNSFEKYLEKRSPYLDYAWLGILGGNVVCAASLSTGYYFMGRRTKKLLDYLNNHVPKHNAEDLREVR